MGVHDESHKGVEAPPEAVDARVSIDHALCSGTAGCKRVAPDVFHVHDGKAWVRRNIDWDSLDRSALETAVETCPWFAIALETGTGPESGPVVPASTDSNGAEDD
jgi:ferredoxin